MAVKDFSRRKATPISAPRTLRMHDIRTMQSLPAGKMVPIAAIPLLREDAARSGKVRLSFESMETVELLMNAINVDVKAYVVPFLAFDRFEGSMDQLNRSYEGVPKVDGGAVVPFIETHAMGTYGSKAVYKYLGMHAAAATLVNTAYLEAYNQIWNFRAANRSKDITLRGRLDTSLAPAFWKHNGFRHIVPDFDQASIDGEIALNLVSERLPVKGIGMASGGLTAPLTTGVYRTVKETGTPGAVTYPTAMVLHPAANNQDGTLAIKGTGTTAANFVPEIYAELQGAGVTISLSNLELAKKTQAFAKLRAEYTGHTDDYLIDLLMDGISVPDTQLTQPILIGEASTVFGMAKRYASDAANLTESVVNGATYVDINIRCPRLGTGGVIMIVAEITPEQLFERQKDPFFHADSVDDFPQYLRDTLDPEKVVIVPNNYVDTDHDTPNATFGYAPLNHEWNYGAPKIGGKFYRPEVNASFDEDRQRLWAVETENPVLSQDFYLCTNMHTKPFVVTNKDPFEVVTRGSVVIEGHTVFGANLIEASNDYDSVLAEAPIDRIVKP